MGQTRNLRDGQITIKDGAGTPLSVVLSLESGDLSYSEKTENVQVLDRGSLDHVRPGDEVPVDISFSVKIDRVSEATSPVTLHDALTGTRSASSWVTVGQTFEPYAVLIEFVVKDPASGGGDDETITFAKVFKQDISFSEGEDFNTVEFSGISWETRPSYS